jgi:prepilin-type N-terminal cleavage/methylation domain-containing protein
MIRSVRSESGFTLVEMIIAMSLSLVVVLMVYQIFSTQQKALGVQEQINYMNQSSRSAMNFLIRKIRNAGYDPLETGRFSVTDSNFATTTAPTSTAIYFTLDSDGNGTVDFNDDERIGFRWNGATTLQIAEVDGGTGSVASWSTLANNVTAFNVTYLDETGAATTDYDEIRQINISMTCQTEKADPNYSPNSGHRTTTVSTMVRPRNLGLQAST